MRQVDFLPGQAVASLLRPESKPCYAAELCCNPPLAPSSCSDSHQVHLGIKPKCESFYCYIARLCQERAPAYLRFTSLIFQEGFFPPYKLLNRFAVAGSLQHVRHFSFYMHKHPKD